jgi:hypothetical protein
MCRCKVGPDISKVHQPFTFGDPEDEGIVILQSLEPLAQHR